MNSNPSETDSATSYRFAEFTFLVESRDLRRDGVQVALPPQPLELLQLLLEHSGETVPRGLIRQRVWGEGRYVVFDQSLHSCVRRLRAALGDDAQNPRFVATVPRRGYRFVAEVETVKPVGPRWGLGRPASAIAAAVLTTVLTGVLGWWSWRSAAPSAPAQPLDRPTRLAVLPVTAEDGSTAATVEGLTLDLIATLSRMAPGDLQVIAHGSVTAPQIEEASANAVAELLDVDFVLRAQLQSTESPWRASATLWDATREVVWSSSTSTSEQLVGLRRNLVHLVRDGIRENVVPRAAGQLARVTTSPEAYDAFLAGRYRLRSGTPEGQRDAATHFARAVALDPEFSTALAWKAHAELNWAWSEGGIANPERLGLAETSAQRALAIDPESTEALLALGYIRLFQEWDLAAAGQLLQRAVAIDPGSAWARSTYAAYLAASGQPEAAVDEARQALRLDPLTRNVHGDLCWYLNYAERYNEARQACRQGLAFEPEGTWIHAGLALAERKLGRPQAAVEVWAQAVQRTNPAPVEQWRTVVAEDPYGALEEVDRWLLGRLEPPRGVAPAAPYNFACRLALRGDVEPALESLRDAVARRDAFAIFLAVDPRLESVRSEPTFQEIVAQVQRGARST